MPKIKNDDDRPTDCLVADCLNCRADCLIRLITDHGLWVWDGGELPRWDEVGLPLDARRSTEEGSEPLGFLPGAFSMVRKRPNELPRTARGRSHRGVDATINYDAFTFGGCKKFSKRMAMQSNCDGSSREFESQKNNELSAASGERIKILILMFLPPRRVVEPIV